MPLQRRNEFGHRMYTTMERCAKCKAPLTIANSLLTPCACGLTFCLRHRMSTRHNCSFDYRQRAQDSIAQANPVIKDTHGYVPI